MASVGQEALQFFQAHGLTRAQAAGIVGNMKQESGLDPNARGGGLIQGQGGRTSKGSAQQQFQGVLKELQGPERNTFKALKATKTPGQAAKVFSQQFERPGIPMLANREKYANEAFGGKAGGPAARTEAAPKGIPGLPKSPEMQEVPNPRAKGLEALQGLLKEEKGSSSNPLLASGVLQKAAEPTFQPIPSAPSQAHPPAHPEDEPKLAAIVAEADHISGAHVPYLWGGGHGAKIQPGAKVTPLDCSGAVSAALGINPKVSGEFESWGAAGKGAHLTIYANGKHVLMEVNGKFWGTSGHNPGGGAGWIPQGVITPAYLKAFKARHPATEQIVAQHGPNPIVKTGGGHTLYIPRDQP